MSDLWRRLHEQLTRMSDRLGVGQDGKPNVFHNTLVTNAVELCDMLRDLNVTNDPDLETARKQLENVLLGVEPDELRKNPAVRESVKTQVESVLDSYNWG